MDAVMSIFTDLTPTDVSTQVMPTTWIAELGVDIWDNGTEYFYTLAAYDRTGGMSWEHESMLTYPTIGEAHKAGVQDAEQRIEWQHSDFDQLWMEGELS
jgi:hypothetical protein